MAFEQSGFIGGLSTYLLLEYVHYNISEGCPHNYYRSMSTNLYRRVVHIIIIEVCSLQYIGELST